ncbi:Type II secretion system protein F [Hydrogenovibrio crunogenus]|uniref:General secretion pathway protein F n=1 Tax=Hydrogenovibrio crunogenus TaxID=39765 RepID=A0A4P7NX20_9GAMM|nr:type II secretion system inner membrane protein GspF [Hydrogenovibrio crunogenus]QBZ82237.1 Type II secretion system protein F [Hydrogenovibrio crunogenus]
MPSFEYQALTSSGRTQKGTQEGESARQVRQQLRDQGLTPLDVTPVVDRRKALSSLSWLTPKIPIADLSLMTRQIFTLLGAGMPMADALRSVANQAENKVMKRFATGIFEKVSEGHSYAQALTSSGFNLPSDYVATVRAGEESGHLVEVLSRMAESIEKQEKIRKKMRSALIYPTLMVVMAVAIILFLMAFVVPKVVSVFDNMNQSLPPLTQGLLSTSEFLDQHWGWLLLGGIGMIVVYKMLMQKERWRSQRDQVLLSVPALRKFLVYSASARWARTLGVLHASGVPITEALRISSEVMNLLPLKQKVMQMEVEVREGQKLYSSMKQAKFFPALLLNLVETGEGNGQVDVMLLKGAEHYEEEVDTAATTLVSLLEPIMIVIMGGVVLTIVLAIMLPIFQMNSMVG